jgi:hypothetical protein
MTTQFDMPAQNYGKDSEFELAGLDDDDDDVGTNTSVLTFEDDEDDASKTVVVPNADGEDRSTCEIRCDSQTCGKEECSCRRRN